MLFNSIPFLVFFTVFFSIYLLINKRKPRIFLCLVGSYFFYAWWDWRFLSLIIFSTLVDYTLGKMIHQSEDERRRRNLLIFSLVSNLGLLFFFKYFNFFIESFAHVTSALGMKHSIHTLRIILPVGISFYTFQTLSYTIDIYRRKLEPENDIMTFATYVAFFPQLVAGPIVRAVDLLPQFKEHQKLRLEQVGHGLYLVVLGYFKKVAVADSLAPMVDNAFANPSAYGSLNLIVAVLMYAFQIYCDFSGYSDIAIGLGKMLGFEFPQNFNMPYFAKNFSDFWRRWHISLSSWLRDYLYIPLGGNRHGVIKTQRNLMLTMVLGGLWHGANWTFVIWGFLHGLYLIAQRVSNPLIVRIERVIPKAPMYILATVTTFILVNIAWVFFRSQSFNEALDMLSRIAAFENMSLAGLKHKFQLFKAAIVIGVLFSGEMIYFLWPQQVEKMFGQRPYVKLMVSTFLIWMILLFGTFSNNNFIYFQF